MSNFLSYLYVFSVLFQLLIRVNNPPFKPGERFEHTATIVDNKLFILGGFGEKEGKELFYLDVSSPFTTLEPSWNDLTDINTLEAHWGATSVNGGADNSSLILYGGIQYNKDSSHSNFPLIHIFDAQNNSWSVPEVPGQEQIFHFFISGVIDNSGQMYTLDIIYQQMVVFDTIDLTLWKKSSINNIFMTFYVAVLLPDQNIIYFSDSDGADPNLSEVLLYNTIDDRWRVQETIGNIPSNRSDFSAVLALDGQRVIIFGGMNTNTMELIPGEDALYILEMKNFEWYIPKVSGNFPARCNHKANIIGKYMVVTFGLFYFDKVHILLLDISNNDEYIWTTEFTNMAIQIKSNIFYFMIVIFHVLYHLL